MLDNSGKECSEILFYGLSFGILRIKVLDTQKNEGKNIHAFFYGIEDLILA
jgi:hypothetical protein